MADLTNINPTLFGGDRIDFNLPDPNKAGAGMPGPTPTAPAHLAIQGTQVDLETRATQEQLQRPDPTAIDAVSASIANFSTQAIWDGMTGAEYPDDPYRYSL